MTLTREGLYLAAADSARGYADQNLPLLRFGKLDLAKFKLAPVRIIEGLHQAEGTLSAFFDGCAHEVSPFRPRTIVVPHIRVSQQILQDVP